MTRVPCVDVVVITWNDGPLLDVAVESALESVGVDVRVIVVDNGSDPPAEVPDDSRISLMRLPQNLGVAAGRNVGIHASSNPYVCLLDSDARLHPDTLSRLVAHLEQDERIALAAPVFDGQPAEASGGLTPGLLRKVARAAGATSTYAGLRPDRDGLHRVDFAIGACQLIRRDRLEAVGGLDESYFYGPEDVDLCLRLRARGWHVVQARDAGCHHPPRRRNRRLLSRRGMQHAWAVCRHLWRSRDVNGRLRREPQP